MGANISNDREGVTVHAMNPVHQGGPVFYTSLTRDTDSHKGRWNNGQETKHLLISTLWDHFVATESPLWNHNQSSNRAAFPIQVLCGLLGKPYLRLGGYRGPAISFSEGGGKLWAALCGDDADIGIDVAETDEFHGDYPFHRVFHPQEFQHALSLVGGDLEEASALLWSIKEAVVKALGCAFHLVDPRQINVYPSAGEDDGYTFAVSLSGKAKVRFPIAACRSLWVRSLPQSKLWISIAHLNRRPTGHE